VKVAVMGGGNGAFATAADLSLKGHSVTICELPHMAQNISGVIDAGYIDLEVKPPLERKGGRCLVTGTTDVAAAVKDADVIYIVVPAFGQRPFAEAICPHVKDGQTILLAPGNFMGAAEFAYVLSKVNPGVKAVIGEAQCMVFSGFKEGATKVWISGYKNSLRIAAFPATDNKRLLEVASELHPEMVLGENMLETGLSNTNNVTHPVICVCNAGKIEYTKGEYYFYREGVTPAVGRMLAAVDEERLAIGKAYGVHLLPGLEQRLAWYSYQGAQGKDFSEVLSTNPAIYWDRAPKNLRHRFLVEDVPYGLVPFEILAKLAGVPCPKVTATIEYACILTDYDLRAMGRDFEELGITGMSSRELADFVAKGRYENGKPASA